MEGIVAERIVESELGKKETVYKVRWKNYSPDHDTWEPRKNLEGNVVFMDYISRQVIIN